MLNSLYIIAAKATHSAMLKNNLSMVALLVAHPFDCEGVLIDKETSESLPVFSSSGVFEQGASAKNN
jgi:hypothetical protein